MFFFSFHCLCWLLLQYILIFYKFSAFHKKWFMQSCCSFNKTIDYIPIIVMCRCLTTRHPDVSFTGSPERCQKYRTYTITHIVQKLFLIGITWLVCPSNTRTANCWHDQEKYIQNNSPFVEVSHHESFLQQIMLSDNFIKQGLQCRMFKFLFGIFIMTKISQPSFGETRWIKCIYVRKYIISNNVEHEPTIVHV